MIAVTNSWIEYEVDWWNIFKIRKLQKQLGYKWWQLGRCNWEFTYEDKCCVQVEYIGIYPFIWLKTYLHEQGHAEITKKTLQKYDTIYDMQVIMADVQKENNAYDAWNWHGVLFWRNAK